MLGKLLKYEFKSTARILIPLYIISIIFSGVCRVFQMLSSKLNILTTPMVLLYVFYFVFMIAIIVVTFIITIQRFYKNLIGDEGYLMFTLPVEPHEHIITKALTAFTWSVSSVIVAAISIFILVFTPGLFDDIKELLAMIPKEMIPNIVYSIGIVIISVISGIFMIYTAISIGQLVTGHKMIGSVVAYFGMYMINQIIMSIILAIFGYFNRGIFTDESAILGVISPILIISLIVYIILCSAYFIVTNYIFKNKLNLE